MPRRIPLPSAALAFLAAAPLSAQQAPAANGWDPQQVLRTETFVKPPANIERMIMAPRVDISFTNPSPDARWFLRTSGADRGDIKAYGAPHIWLGGLQIDTRANRARSVTTSTRTGIVLVDPRTGAERKIAAPAGTTISSPVWSPRGTHVAYLVNFPTASYVHVLDVANGRSTRLSERPLLATLVTDVDFTADGRHVVAVLVPANRSAAPVLGGDGVADGPDVRLTESRAVPQPVHFSLLANPHEKRLLQYHTTGQVVLIDVRTRALKTVGAPAMVRNVDASHDGQFLRVTRMTEPFSYLVPVSSFGGVQELWDASGKVVATLARTPLRESGRDGGDAAPAVAAASDTGKRNMQWNPIGPGLLYVQNVPAPAAPATPPVNGRSGAEGGPSARAGAAPVQVRAPRGQVVVWKAPYGPNDTTVLYRGGPQLGTVLFSLDSSTMFVSDSGAVIAVRVNNPTERWNLGRNVSLPVTITAFGGAGFGGGRSSSDSTAGTLVSRKVGNATYVVLGTDGKQVALTGTRAPGANWYKQAPRPWLDRMDITTKVRTRLMDSPADVYEEFMAPLDRDLQQFIVTRENRTTITDAWLRTASSTEAKQLTKNVDVGPEVSGAQFRRFQVTRPRDGTKYWVEVTLPRDWKPGQRLPGIIWFYPREYSTLTAYEQSRQSVNINAFPAVPSARPASSMQLWVSQGYAFIQPDIPIYGDAGRMNDNYTRDLEENLDAVLDAAVDSGFVDRDKMGIGGHSYGAFSTVNAMTLMPNFKAGIAGDGMYNRTLTPFGFQSERRNFFQAKETYMDMSPFLRADKLAGALLLYHAWEDQNTGTAPMSSTRLFAALQGLGKPAALYMYPYEDHSVATYASDLDLWARWVAWMDVHVKNGGKVEAVRAVQP
ncbi:prolyl oligopeptidase family serine peptidase [Gemmatimonas sp.]|uniref:prolyl oligopeptidase family serine peptidase n=1 Tax=Gemmatimonas sp. TaxID=1962908 RepID=UPI0025B7E0F6|nr:prolyl oligopeptidase family serine peptidase [Gemmatimonas sp.]MCA2992633.1 prolyl oligopeptidase family serine peptidase [Gemmatimonas sp.]